jgi:hypothetical protein
MSEETTVTEPTTEAARPSISLQDIASVVEILRVCTDRGVWRIGELSAVGQLYDRLTNFLEAAGVKVDQKPNE